MTSRPDQWHAVDACPHPIAHKSKTNSHSITKIDRRVPHSTCDTAHLFQGQTQGYKLTSSVRLISASSLFGKQNAVPVSLEAGRGIPCRPNPAAHFLLNYVWKYTDKINIQSRGTPFLNQMTDAAGSAFTLHSICTVSPSVTFILWGRWSIDWNTGLTVAIHNTTDALQF